MCSILSTPETLVSHILKQSVQFGKEINLYVREHIQMSPPLIVNILISNYNLITHFFLSNCNILQLHLFCYM